MRLTSTTQPPVVDPFGVAFVMQGRNGLVRCHVFRAAIDELGESYARNDEEALRRFERHRTRLETIADRMHGAGHQSPWIDVPDLLLGVTPEDHDD